MAGRGHRPYPPVQAISSRRQRLCVGSRAVAYQCPGVVRSASVAGSSGNAALDRAAVETVRRASPVPVPPPEIARASMTLAITISFKR
ncbi:energy transducer TonB [Mesorhizobium amorphae]|uniref:energy transducer TonB family protein n=1 Tax=Mesorhizobium amorphae TaxID=71433 RepID=UPI001186D691